MMYTLHASPTDANGCEGNVWPVGARQPEVWQAAAATRPTSTMTSAAAKAPATKPRTVRNFVHSACRSCAKLARPGRSEERYGTAAAIIVLPPVPRRETRPPLG